VAVDPILTIDGDTVRFGAASAAGAELLAFHERYDRWTGRAWLEVQGPGWRIPIGPGYGEARRALRDRFADRPWSADWEDGAFPQAPGGFPVDLATAAATLVVAALASLVAYAIGPTAALLVAVAGSWPASRLRDGVVIRRTGIRIGPPWTPFVPWHELRTVKIAAGRRRARVWALPGGAIGTVPAALVPALRARVWRLGGLALDAAPDGLDDTYERWRAPSVGIPWGLLVGTVIAAVNAVDPWPILTAGVLAMAATGLLSAAVEARSTGWGAGAVLWSTGAYGVVLTALALGFGGWFS
jgi:hypothetical protein